MTIGTGATVEFFNGQSALATTSGAVLNNGFSVAGDLNTISNSLDVGAASFVLRMQYTGTLSSSPYVVLFLQQLDIDGTTNDAPVPSATFVKDQSGIFTIDSGLATATNTYVDLVASLPNVKSGASYQPFIQNRTGGSISAGWELWVNLKTVGPKA